MEKGSPIVGYGSTVKERLKDPATSLPIPTEVQTASGSDSSEGSEERRIFGDRIKIERPMEDPSAAPSSPPKAPSFLPTFDGDSSGHLFDSSGHSYERLTPSPIDGLTPPTPPIDAHHHDAEPDRPPARASRRQQRRPSGHSGSFVANSITGHFSDISLRYSVDYTRVLDPGTDGGLSVCVCSDLETGELYAVKSVAKGQHHARGGKQEDLHREVTLLRDLRDEAREEGGEWHGIVELVDLHETPTDVHIVTELCRGGELTDRIQDRVEECESLREQQWTSPPCFSDGDASTVLRQVLGALNFLHSRDIVHRDVEPENILFVHPEGTKGPDGRDVGLTVRLIDLGVARYHHVSSFEPRMSTVVGTCTFMAPEVLRRHYDRRCDHWSLGVVAYVMMCGYPPFVGETNEEVCEAVLKGRFRFDPKDWGDVSKDAEAFVKGLLKFNVKSRIGGEEAMDHPFIAVGGARDGRGEEEDDEDESEGRRIKREEREHTTVHLPHVHLPHVHLPHVHLPHVHLPHAHLPKVGSKVHLPKVLSKEGRLRSLGHKSIEKDDTC